MTILSRNGIRFQTKALSFEQAQRFAQCVNANGQYQDVEIVPKGAKFVVNYRPTSADRAAKLTAAQAGTREERAAAQADCYAVCEVPGGFQVCNLLSGACYLVNHAGKCDCPDHHHRCQGNGVACKHSILVRNFQQQEREAAHLTSRANPLPAHVAAVRARMSDDFPA